MRTLASRIEMMLQGETDMPSLLSFSRGRRKKNEEVYLNESILGHSFSIRHLKI